MKELFCIILLSFFAIGCNTKPKENLYNYTEFSQYKYISANDSGFTLKIASIYGWKYFPFKVDKDKITLYSDSLYEYSCGLNLRYPIINQNSTAINKSNCTFSPTGIKIENRYEYVIKLSSYNCPSNRPHLSSVLFYYNGIANSIEIDSLTLRSYIPTFEDRIYYANDI